MNLEIAYKKIDDAKRELTKIFDIVTSEKEISLYKSKLLESKISIIDNTIAEMLDILKKESLECVDKIEKYKKIFFYFMIFSFAFTMINLFVGLPIFLISVVTKAITDMKFERELEEVLEVIKVTKKALEILPIMDNCNTFLYSRTNYNIREKEGEIQDIELRRLQLANDIIHIGAIGIPTDDIPVEVQDCIRKILQDDLKTEENDINVLMEMVTEKFVDEAQRCEEENVITRTRKPENDKK